MLRSVGGCIYIRQGWSNRTVTLWGLERSRLHVSSVCGAIPGEVKTGQALPSCAREIAESKHTWVIIIIIQVEYIISIGLDCQRDAHPP